MVGNRMAQLISNGANSTEKYIASRKEFPLYLVGAITIPSKLLIFTPKRLQISRTNRLIAC